MIQIQNKTIITGQIRLLSGLHIGSGQMSMKTDATVMKDAFDKPYIPGSSLKGVLRTISERLHQLVLDGSSVPVCYLAKDDCNDKSKLKEELLPFIREGKEDEVNQKIDESICPICQLFGSTFRASKIVVSDCHLANEENKEVTTVRHSVRIDRDSGTAKDGAKFDYEVVNAGEVFSFQLEAENLNPQDEKLLYLALHEFVNGKVQLGGKISSGLGSVELENAKVRSFNFSKEEDKKAYLKYVLKPSKDDGVDITEKINDVFQLV